MSKPEWCRVTTSWQVVASVRSFIVRANQMIDSTNLTVSKQKRSREAEADGA